MPRFLELLTVWLWLWLVVVAGNRRHSGWRGKKEAYPARLRLKYLDIWTILNTWRIWHDQHKMPLRHQIARKSRGFYSYLGKWYVRQHVSWLLSYFITYSWILKTTTPICTVDTFSGHLVCQRWFTASNLWSWILALLNLHSKPIKYRPTSHYVPLNLVFDELEFNWNCWKH